MAKKMSPEAGRAIVREIGRVTFVRLTIYYVLAGAVLLLLEWIFPEQAMPESEPGPVSSPGATLDWFRHEIAVFPMGAPRWVDALVQMFGALLLVLPMAFVYVRTRTRLKYDHSLVQTVIVLPIVVTAILVVVRNSLALAFSLAGIVAAVRFRNDLKESGDAVYIFGSIGIGFATGIHALSVAAVLSIVFVLVELALWKFNFNAEFEETFARLCLPSGADMAALSQATGEYPRPVPSNGGADADGRTVALRIYVDAVEPAKGTIETILQRDAKRWSLVQASDSDGGPKVLEYRVRPRKSVGLDGLRERLLREGAPHVVAADDVADGKL
jgi:Domain of unknown function (DUF4956)